MGRQNPLLWYLAFLIGGFALLIENVRCLLREIACLLQLTRKPRIYPTIHPLFAILLSIGTFLFGVALWALHITLVLPLLVGVWALLTRRHREVKPPLPDEQVGRHWHYYDGMMYVIALGSFTAEIAGHLEPFIPKDSSLLDICCGPGMLSLHFAPKCRRVVGLDHALGMVRYAGRQAEKNGTANVQFVHADATQLGKYTDGEFDVAIISMALHEMPRDIGLAALKEANRVAKTLLLVDYAVPLPKHIGGLVYRYLEFIAGLEHLRGFLRYTRCGGLDTLLEQAGLKVVEEVTVSRGCIRVVRTKHVPTLNVQTFNTQRR